MRIGSPESLKVRAGLLSLAWGALLLFCADVASAVPLFEEPVSYLVDALPLGVRSGEFDLDPGLDLVTANQAGEDGPSLSFLPNRGDGTMLAERRMQLNDPQYILQALTSADFNEDGYGDVAVAVDDASVFPLRAMILVYLGDGLGGLQEPTEYLLTGFFPVCLEAADVSGDGVLDLTVCHTRAFGDTAIGLISVLTGRAAGDGPSGTFDPPMAFPVGTTPSTVAVARLDSDNHPDVVVGEFDDGRIHILYGTGSTGLLAAATELARVSTPTAIAVTNIDTTQRKDILVTSFSTHRLVTFSQTASRRFADPRSTLIALLPAGMQAADLSEDGNTDLVVVSALGEELWFGNGLGQFGFAERLSSEATLDDVILVDMNDDGHLDTVASSSSTDQVVVALRTMPLGPGDANCDGQIDNRDLPALLARLFSPGCGGADVNTDGRVTAADVPLLLQIVAGSDSI